jgi:hypothetical protein
LLTVKQHPHGKILRNILETMGNMRGTEQHVTRTNCGYRFLDSIMATSGGDEIEFIALMRNLRSVGGASGDLTSRSPSTNTSDERPGVRGRASAAASDTGGGVRSMVLTPDKETRIAHHTEASNINEF